MENNTGFTDVTPTNVTDVQVNLQSLASIYLTYKIAEALNQSYLLIFVPFGILGNILSFLVMIQPHNRHMSLAWYICALAMSDTGVVFLALFGYLHLAQGIEWNCVMAAVSLWTCSLCSSFFILSMTFERFYSIIRPHKAASFNTVKRAKITIICIVLFSILYNIPHWFTTQVVGKKCLPYNNGIHLLIGRIYYWTSNVIHFFLPFTSLLIMNTVIIHILRKRSMSMSSTLESQGQNKGQSSKVRSAERQVFIMLLTLTFMFLILTTPGHAMVMFSGYVNYRDDPAVFAGFHLFFAIGEKTFYTNYGINFYLYIISGQKFRKDLFRLFKTVFCCKSKAATDNSQSSEINTVVTVAA